MKWMRFSVAPTRLVVLAVVVAVGVSLGIAALTGSFSARAAPAVVYVNDNALPDVEGCNAPDATTITAGITAADSGDTVIVCEGTYAGATINKSLTVRGRPEASRAAVIVEGASDGLVITADDVTIRHLRLDGPTGDRGIWIGANADGVTIDDVEVTDWSIGIRIEDNEGTVVRDSDVSSNVADGISASGSTGTEITGSTIADNGDDGIELLDQDETLVQGNTISGNSDTQIEIDGTMHVRILANEIDIGSDGIRMTALGAEAFVQIGGSTDEANTFSGTPGGGDYYVSLDCTSENTVDATYNWWGTLVRSEIADLIFNDEDDDGSECALDHDGSVVFHPWAAGPAPTATPSPTPTPSPTATPTATPAASPTATPVPPTRNFDLPAGWNDFVWTGASDTTPATALGCIDGDYAIAYRFLETTQTFQRYVAGDALLSNMGNLSQYDSLLVLVTPVATQCLAMPVAQ